MAYRIVPFTMTLNDLQSHSAIASFLKMKCFIHLCSSWQDFNRLGALLGQCAIVELLVGYSDCWTAEHSIRPFVINDVCNTPFDWNIRAWAWFVCDWKIAKYDNQLSKILMHRWAVIIWWYQRYCHASTNLSLCEPQYVTIGGNPAF